MISSRPQSDQLYNASLARMPGGVNSPVRAFKGLDMIPLVVEQGKGDTLWDVDGYKYIDYCLSWGSLILGHADEGIIHHTHEQMKRGSSFGIVTPYELLLAQKIHTHLPTLEKLRFVSSGTEATMSAIRLARGFTGRDTIVKFEGHYHGHADCLLIQSGSGVTHLPQATSQGIPHSVVQNTVCLPFNRVEPVRSFLRTHSDVAAVIVEPIAGNMGVIPAEREFIEMLREETAVSGALLIFDEVITGFRIGLQGAQGYYRVEPDLTCLGKIIGGGYPVAAFGGRKEVMDLLAPLGPVYQGGTLSGNPVGMCAGLHTLIQVEKEAFYQNLEEKTCFLLDPLKRFIEERHLPILIAQVGSMFTLFFGVTHVKGKEDLRELDEVKFRSFFRYLFERGIYPPPSACEAWFLSSAHTEESLKYTRDVIFAFFKSQC